MGVVLWGGRKGDIQYNSKLDRALWRIRARRIDMTRGARKAARALNRLQGYRAYEEQKEIRDRPRRIRSSNHLR